MAQEKVNYIGSILLEFPVKPEVLEKDETAEDVLDAPVSKALNTHFAGIRSVLTKRLEKYGRITIFTADKGVTATLRTYPRRSTVTVTVEYDVKEFEDVSPVTYDNIKNMEAELVKHFEEKKATKALTELKRGLPFDKYFTSSDDRLMEYDIQEILFDEQSSFQHVQIARSINYGNILILDDLVNLAEADLAYTHGLMCYGKTDFTGKDVLILGGGDGALLYELRKEKAKSITMIEIDDTVMQACKVHLRGACDNTLDSYKNENYEVVVGDCLPYIEKCQTENKHFDCIFGDLTDIPICLDGTGDDWEFVKKIVKLSFSILKPDGTYFTHANGISATASLAMFKKVIHESLDNKVDITTTENFVPSFQEKWVFYQVKRTQ